MTVQEAAALTARNTLVTQEGLVAVPNAQGHSKWDEGPQTPHNTSQETWRAEKRE